MKKSALALSVLGIVAVLVSCTAQTTPHRTSTPKATTQAPHSAAPTKAGLIPELGTPEDVVTGMTTPWSLIFVGETPLVSERDTGRVREILPDGSTRVVGEVPGVQHRGGEGGLLGLAVDDDQRLYAYSSGDSGNRVQRFALTGGAGNYGIGGAKTVISDLPESRYHNGGRIAIGPDGMLYVAVGDAQDSDSAQNPDSLAGKILRMTLDGDTPADNPEPGSLVYSLGHRNVQGMAWDSSGQMYASEFGEHTWDELNVIEPGGNYGWPVVEGTGGREGLIDPVQQWSPADASPSGLTIVDDVIYIANLRGQVLRAVSTSSLGDAQTFYSGELGRLRAVTPAPDGSLWLLTSNTDGIGDPRDNDDRILRIPLS